MRTAYARADKQGAVSIRRVADDKEIAHLLGSGSETFLLFSRDGEFLSVHCSGGLKVWKVVGPDPVEVMSLATGVVLCGNFSATLGEIGLSSSGNAVAYGFDVLPGSIPVVKVPAGLNQWHRVGIILNYSDVTTSVAYTLNGQIIGVMPTNDSSKILLRGAMVVYALPDGGGKARINYTARFDNYQVSVQGNHGDNDD